MKKKSITAIIAAGTLLFAACGDDEASSDVSTAETTMTADTMAEEATTTGEIVVEGAWARTSPMEATMGAAYMKITSPIDDELVSASVDPSVAMEAQIHETVENDAGEMSMQEVESIPLVAGEAFELAPGGYHVMLMGLSAPLEVGSTLDIALTMKSGATVTVTAEVSEDAPSM